MASNTTLPPPTLRLLEQHRQRLLSLTGSLTSLRKSIALNPVLPPIDSIHNSLDILRKQLQGLTDALAEQSSTMSKVLVHPDPAFPGRDAGKEALLGVLLRKKLEPRVEAWEDEGRALAQATSGTGEARDVEGLEELWRWAAESVERLVVEAVIKIERRNYTDGEVEGGIENVRTGLRRRPKLENKADEEESSEEEEEEDEDMEGGGMEDVKERYGGRGNEHGDVRSVEEMMRFGLVGGA